MARRTKSMLKRIDVERAKRKRKCMNASTDILAGQMCIVLWDDPRDRYVYSREVALRMVEAARTRLDEIVRELVEADGGDEE